jgi:hypothetical protein
MAFAPEIDGPDTCPSRMAGQKFRTGGSNFSFIDLTKRQMDWLRGASENISIGLEAGL